MHLTKHLAAIGLGAVLFSGAVSAKPITRPRSLVHEGTGVLLASEEIAARNLRFADFSHTITEVVRPGARRVAVPIPLALSPDDDGTWESLPDGGSLWRLRVNSEGAIFLSFKLSALALPKGAELHFSSVYRDFHDGPYTHRHNGSLQLRQGLRTRRFGSPMIPGDAAVIELYLPPGAGAATVVIESVSHGFRDAMGMQATPYRDTAAAQQKRLRARSIPQQRMGNFDCQRDINCPEGAPYQDDKRAVAEGFDGAFICSGQLVNNVREDNRYLYITAAHCEWWKDPAGMSYFWNYENSGCGTNDFPPFTFTSGSTNLFHNVASDVNLLELDGTDLENTFNIYFMGWNRGDTAPTMAAIISFPDDKPKQITIENDAVLDCEPNGCSGGWGEDWWRVTGWDIGMDEGGSSGGGLIDQNHRVVGVLTGGVGTDCNDFVWDEFAKIGRSWTGLQPFLDPDNTGAVTVDGKDGLTDPDPAPPGAASNPNPADGAANVAVGAVLSWSAGSQADSHDVYFGLDPSPGAGDFQGNQPQASFDPGTLANETTYYWRIDEVNALGTTAGAVWSFTTQPVAPADTVTITKAEYKSDKDEFKVQATSSQQPAAVLTVEGWGEMSWKNNKYELKIKPLAPLTAPSTVTVTSDLGGSDTAAVQGAPDPPGPPGAASSPNPGDGAAGVNVAANLTWTAGSGATSHDVYFGTTASPGFQGNQTGTTFDPGTLADETTYYWRIDEVNGEGTTAGAVCSFTTAAAGGSGDTVTITKAEGKAGKQELKVQATSSDPPAGVLTLVGFGEMSFKNGKYEYKEKPVANPGTVTVSSSGGGSDTATVDER